MPFQAIILDIQEISCTCHDVNEIIEIGCLYMKSEKITSIFKSFNKPKLHYTLQDSCSYPASIKQKDIDSAEDLSEVLIDFTNWLGNINMEEGPLKVYVFEKWPRYRPFLEMIGIYDTILPTSLSGRTHKTIKHLLNLNLGVTVNNLLEGLACVILQPIGHRNRSLYNIVNMAQILQYALKNDWRF